MFHLTYYLLILIYLQDGAELLNKYYSSGMKCLTLFPDGSAQVLYPLRFDHVMRFSIGFKTKTRKQHKIIRTAMGKLKPEQIMCDFDNIYKCDILILIVMVTVIPQASWLSLSWSLKKTEGSASCMMTAMPHIKRSEQCSSLMAGRHVITAVETYGTKQRVHIDHFVMIQA